MNARTTLHFRITAEAVAAAPRASAVAFVRKCRFSAAQLLSSLSARQRWCCRAYPQRAADSHRAVFSIGKTDPMQDCMRTL